MYLRNFKEEYKLLRNLNNPIIIMGLPLKLALYYLGALIGAIMLALILSSLDYSIVIVLVVPVGIVMGAILGIKKFYKEYGINGFYQQKRDGNIPSKIEADFSIEQILKKKTYETK